MDRAALEFGRRAGIAIGGWCPAGGWAEDLPEPPGLLELFPELEPTPSLDPRQRSRWNVRDTSATLVIVRGRTQSPGTEFTIAVAEELDRPHLVADVREIEKVRSWLAELPHGAVLNVAGPRESQAPGIQAAAGALLDEVLG